MLKEEMESNLILKMIKKIYLMLLGKIYISYDILHELTKISRKLLLVLLASAAVFRLISPEMS